MRLLTPDEIKKRWGQAGYNEYSTPIADMGLASHRMVQGPVRADYVFRGGGPTQQTGQMLPEQGDNSGLRDRIIAIMREMFNGRGGSGQVNGGFRY